MIVGILNQRLNKFKLPAILHSYELRQHLINEESEKDVDLKARHGKTF